jgi:hypothetical protein
MNNLEQKAQDGIIDDALLADNVVDGDGGSDE